MGWVKGEVQTIAMLSTCNLSHVTFWLDFTWGSLRLVYVRLKHRPHRAPNEILNKISVLKVIPCELMEFTLIRIPKVENSLYPKRKLKHKIKSNPIKMSGFVCVCFFSTSFFFCWCCTPDQALVLIPFTKNSWRCWHCFGVCVCVSGCFVQKCGIYAIVSLPGQYVTLTTFRWATYLRRLLHDIYTAEAIETGLGLSEKKVIRVIYLGLYSCILMSIISNIFSLHTYSFHSTSTRVCVCVYVTWMSVYICSRRAVGMHFDEIKGLDSFERCLIMLLAYKWHYYCCYWMWKAWSTAKCSNGYPAFVARVRISCPSIRFDIFNFLFHAILCVPDSCKFCHHHHHYHHCRRRFLLFACSLF